MTRKTCIRFLRLIHESNEQACSVEEGTLGKRIRFSGESISGTILYNEKRVVHCSAFIKERMAVGPKYEYNVA